MPTLPINVPNEEPKKEQPHERYPVLRPFVFHGCYPKPTSGGQAITECPFCLREDKLYVNLDNGLWDCKVCGRKGNPISFLQELHTYSMENTTDAQYRELAGNRQLATTEPLLRWGLAWSSLRNEWIAPGFYQDDSKAKQLYRWSDYGAKDNKRHMLACPSDSVNDELKHCLYGINSFDPNKPDVYLLEGPWDGLAMWEVLRLTKMNDDGTFSVTGSESASMLQNVNVLAVPSTTTFTEDWAKLLTGKRVFLLGHNDHPRLVELGNGKTRIEEPASYKGMKRMVALMIQWDIRPKELYYLAWGYDCKEKSYNPKLKKGYDVRDLLGEGYPDNFPSGVGARMKAIDTKIAQLENFYRLIKPVPQQWVDPTDASGANINVSANSKKGKSTDPIGIKIEACHTLKDLLDKWKDAIIFHDGVEKTIICMLACNMSTDFPGTQLWLRVVSEPSSGKSLLCDAMCTNKQYVTMQSNFRGFFSGMRPSEKSEKEGKVDLGLITEIMGKTFVTKDGDTLLNGPDRPRIMAEARDLYDGKTSTHFRNGIDNKYGTIRTTWILCGTERILDVNDNDLGERFLDCRLIEDMAHEMRSSIAKKAIGNMWSMMQKKVDVKNVETMEEAHILIAKKLTGGYIDYLCKNGEKLYNVVYQNMMKLMASGDTSAMDIVETLAEFTALMRARPAKRDENVSVELHARLSEQLSRLAVCIAVVMNKEKVDNEVIRRVMQIAFDTSKGTTLKICRYLYANPDGATYNKLNSILDQKDDKLTELIRFLRRVHVLSADRGGQWADYKYCLTPRVRFLCDKVFNYEF